LDRLLAGAGGFGSKPEPLDDFFKDAALGGIVIDDQKTLDHGALELNLDEPCAPSNPVDCSKTGHSATDGSLNKREIAQDG
jgi:hypothetical protein